MPRRSASGIPSRARGSRRSSTRGRRTRNRDRDGSRAGAGERGRTFINFAGRRFAAGHYSAAVTERRRDAAATNRSRGGGGGGEGEGDAAARGLGRAGGGKRVCVFRACTGPIKRALTSTGLNRLLNDGGGARLSSAAARHLGPRTVHTACVPSTGLVSALLTRDPGPCAQKGGLMVIRK